MSIKIVPTAIPDVKIIIPIRHRDQRGFFTEVYNKRVFMEAGIELDFVQDNLSFSANKGTVRGLHFQKPPYAQDKLVYVVKGAIFDVAVDLRKDSPSFGKHVTEIITAEEGNQILVPIGFAHGFCTLDPNTEVIYKATNYYAPAHDGGLLWNDPELAIDWLVSEDEAILSEEDRAQLQFPELIRSFTF